MLKMTIDNEEVLSNNDISIKEEILSPSSTILNNVYPKTWEQDKDYVSRFYYPKDYSKLNIQNFSVEPEEAGTTIQVNESATLTDVDTSKESRVLRVLGNTSQETTTGKNLFNINATHTGVSSTTYKYEYTLKPNTQYTISSNVPNSNTANVYANGTSSSTNKVCLNNSQTITSDANGYFYVLVRYVPASGDSSTINMYQAILNGTYYLQIEEGSSATSYEPYTGGVASPNPNYPQPVNVVSGDNEINICGKNLFNKDNVRNGYRLGSDGTYYRENGYSASEKISVIPNTTYYRNITIQQMQPVCTYDENDNFIARLTSGNSFTTPSNCYYIRTAVANTNLDTCQLEKSSTASTYEPYIGNSYPISLGVENLFDKDNADIISGYFDANHTNITSAGTNRTTYCQVQPNTTYYVSKLRSARGFVGTAQVQPVIGTSISNITNIGYGTYDGTTIDSGTITTGANDNYIVINYTNTNADTGDAPTNILNSIQVTKGSTAQYITDTPIELCKIGTYQDYIYKENDKWYLHKEIGKVVFDGSENWEFSAIGVYRIASVYPSNVALRTEPPFAYSNYYKYAYYSANITTLIQNGEMSWNGSKYPVFRNDSCEYASKFKTWLSTHNAEVYYVLATPTDTEITDTTLLEQLESLSS